uniref:Uncharacterized protein n=1 Tax=Arundo donax TaxID=35708 RepID=A0A0A9G3G6_ARUDO
MTQTQQASYLTRCELQLNKRNNSPATKRLIGFYPITKAHQ